MESSSVQVSGRRNVLLVRVEHFSLIAAVRAKACQCFLSHFLDHGQWVHGDACLEWIEDCPLLHLLCDYLQMSVKIFDELDLQFLGVFEVLYLLQEALVLQLELINLAAEVLIALSYLLKVFLELLSDQDIAGHFALTIEQLLVNFDRVFHIQFGLLQSNSLADRHHLLVH